MSTALSMFPAPMRAEVEGGHRLALGVFVDIGNGFSTQSVLTVDEMGNLGFTKMDQINLECGYLAEEDRWVLG